MISKETMIQDITHEIKIIKHLAEKILPDTHNWKPTEGQRSILELLQYLSHIGSTFATMISTGSIDHFAERAEKAKTLTADQFQDAMDRQIEDITSTINALTDDQQQENMNFFGGMVVPKSYVILSLLKTLVAYRMQLFLYVKQSGRNDLNTANNWMGVDMAM